MQALRRTPPEPRFAEVRAGFARSIARRRRAGFVTIALPAPVAPIAALLDAPSLSAAWESSDGTAVVGLGTATRLDTEGPDANAELRARAAALWTELESIPLGAKLPDRPVLLGGLAYAPGARDAVWAGFADASFELPRWTYRRVGAQASLHFCVRGNVENVENVENVDNVEDSDGALAELEQLWAALLAPSCSTATATGVRITEADRAAYRAAVTTALAAIADGALTKVVLARRLLVEADQPFAPATVLDRLAGAEVTRFVFRRGDAYFVGASPERLIAKQGRRITTEALAGSIVPGHDDDKLLQNSKERTEHELVVRAITDVLRPWCRQLDVAPAPGLRALRHVVHLATPIRGELDTDHHLLELAAALHPTPAVGGVPHAAARSWITAHEPVPRGWYAGPVGWFDEHGDGELTVALRSAVLRGRAAHLYAGAGIVRGSDPDDELAETGLKLRTMLAALAERA